MCKVQSLLLKIVIPPALKLAEILKISTETNISNFPSSIIN